MGLTLSMLQKFGFPSVQSLSTDQVFDNFFGANKIKSFEDFHVSFINLCNAFNSIMPGKRIKAPPETEVKTCYKKWQEAILKKDPNKPDEWKEPLKELIEKHVTAAQSKDNSLVVMTGMVAPAGAMVLKKSGENVPQLKRFRLHLIPDVVFVPTCTMLALIGVKVLQINMSRGGIPK